jgi:hypothetical protein
MWRDGACHEGAEVQHRIFFFLPCHVGDSELIGRCIGPVQHIDASLCHKPFRIPVPLLAKAADCTDLSEVK